MADESKLINLGCQNAWHFHKKLGKQKATMADGDNLSTS